MVEIQLIDKFSKLPIELINKIINYTDVVVYRYGKYIDRIDKEDKRYVLLGNVPRPMKRGNNIIVLYLMDYKQWEVKGYSIEYTFLTEHIGMTIEFLKRDIDGFDKYINVKSRETYVLDKSSIWRKTFSYNM